MYRGTTIGLLCIIITTNDTRQVPVGKHDNRQHASPRHEVATDVKQMPIRPIIIIGHQEAQKWLQSHKCHF